MTPAKGVTYQSRKAVGRATPATDAASTNHLSCWRSRPVERRKRTASETTAPISAPRNSGIPMARRAPVGSDSTAHGLWPLLKSRPLAGLSDQATMLSTRPAAAIHGSGRQRRLGQLAGREEQEGECPAEAARQPADSGDPLADRTAGPAFGGGPEPQPWARSAASALSSPKPQNSQPIAFSGCRRAINAPAPTVVTPIAAYSSVS